VVEDRTATSRCDEGFIHVRRYRLVNVAGDHRGREYAYDVVQRRHLDAVMMALFDRSGPAVRVMFRMAMRPPLWFRADQALPLPERPRTHVLELPAGLIEAHEHGLDGIRTCAARESLEETGLTVPPASFQPLGSSFFLSPGLCAEKVHLLAAEVDLSAARPPQPEGPVEEAGGALILTLEEAVAKIESGEIDDAKTEIGIRRLVARLS
jgi:ADP-ribose diphosphatase